VRGVGQAASGENALVGRDRWVQTGAAPALQVALRQADVGLEEIDVVQLQDPDTYTVLVTLEDYGFCPKGEGGPFVADGRTGPGGALPVNTGGGNLSGNAAWDFTCLAEAVLQLRGQADARQLDRHELALVGSTGGVAHFHAATVLGLTPAPRAAA
jgi:acetyl-CoA acetyltransferase